MDGGVFSAPVDITVGGDETEMGIDSLIAAIGASLILSSKEAREQRLRERELDAFLARESARERMLSAFIQGKGFHRVRQSQLWRMGQSTLLCDRQEFAKILGRPCYDSNVSVERGIRAIAEKESWTYYKEEDLLFDPEYCKIMGLQIPEQYVLEDRKNQEAERRAKEEIWQLWAQRHPQCFIANVSPEYYETEEDFALVTKYEYSKRKKAKQQRDGEK